MADTNDAMPWAMHAKPIRLRYGYHLFSDAAERWLIATPDQRFIRLKLATEQVVALLPVLDGRMAPRDLRNARADTTLSDILERFGQQNLLETGVEPQQGAQSTHCVLVQGDNPLAEHVITLLAHAHIPHQHVRGSGLPDCLPALLITCVGWLPDTQWQQLDAWCRQHNVMWHMAHAEDTHFYLGPLFVPGKTAGYADVRARRRAAAPFHDELLACWRYLESDRVGPVRWPDVGALAVMAGVIVGDVLAVLGGRPAPSAGYQLGFDPETMTWQRHPVLPVPTDLMSEAEAD